MESNLVSRRRKRLSTLHRIPVELWGQIFEPLCTDWNGKTPNLIIALRADEMLYNEALAVFFRNNVFIFRRGNDWSFRDMKKQAVLTLTKVRIEIELDIMKEGLWKLELSKQEKGILTAVPPVTLADASNIREVTLHFKCEKEAWGAMTYLYSAFVSHGGVTYSPIYFLRQFKILKRVDLVLPSHPNLWHHAQLAAHRSRLAAAIRMSNSQLKSPARLLRVWAFHVEDKEYSGADLADLCERDEWFWQAEKEGNLKFEKKKPPTLEVLTVGMSLEQIGAESSL